jgi:drug/metabolite transporter (DMT)-like permease
MSAKQKFLEPALLGLLALLWGSSYLFIRVAVAEIPLLTLIAARVSVAALLLLIFLALSRQPLPRGARIWRLLFV